MLATTVDSRAEPCLSHQSDIQTERDLPLTISRAITRTMTWRDGEFGQLTRPERSMLVEVLRCVPKGQPEEGAFVRRDTLAVRMDCSLATVTRLLARLEELGWIVRDQVKSRIRGFQVGSIALTRKAMGWLGFDLPASQAERHSSMSDACRLSMQSLRRQPPHAGGSSDELGQAAAPPAAGPHAGGSSDELGQEEQKSRQEARLPAPLRWLLGKVSPWGICKLMGEARKRGVRLEDVAGQCQDQILAADNGFAYVQGLLGLDKDWGYLAEQGRVAAAAEAGQAQAEAGHQRAIAALDGKMFVGADGDVRKVQNGWVAVYAVEEATKSLGTPKGGGPVTVAFACAVDGGELRPWHASEARSSASCSGGSLQGLSRSGGQSSGRLSGVVAHAGDALRLAMVALRGGDGSLVKV